MQTSRRVVVVHVAVLRAHARYVCMVVPQKPLHIPFLTDGSQQLACVGIPAVTSLAGLAQPGHHPADNADRISAVHEGEHEPHMLTHVVHGLIEHGLEGWDLDDEWGADILQTKASTCKDEVACMCACLMPLASAGVPYWPRQTALVFSNALQMI